jgi:hypothetical protein
MGSFNQNDLGIENPTGGYYATHNFTTQLKGFGNFQYLIDDSSRISLILSGTYSQFQIPDNPTQTAVFTLAGFVLMSQMSSTKAISFGAGQGLASSLRNSVHEEAFSAA